MKIVRLSKDSNLNRIEKVFNWFRFSGRGPTGEGVPIGGTTDQLLAKIDGDDFNAEWVNTFNILNHGTITGATTLNATTASTQTADFIASFTATLAGFTGSRQSIAFEFVVASGTPTVTLAGSIFKFYTTLNLSALAAGSYVAYFKSSDSGANTKVFVKLAP